MNDKIVGIIGGMGPEATAFYYMKFIKKTKVHKDQEHFRVIIDSNSKIPDRTRAILYGEQSPLPEIKHCIRTLNAAAVDIGFVTCITSHHFIRQMKQEASFILIDALEELDRFIRTGHPDIKKIGILATSGTGKTGLFDRYLNDFDLLYPDETCQRDKVMAAIYSEDFGIKGGYTEGICLSLLEQAGQALIEQGAQLLIAGCTEIGMVMKDLSFSVPIIDPMDCAIEAIIRNG